MPKPCVIIDFEEAVSYRTPSPVSAVRCFRVPSGVSSYPVCPRCQITIEREYQAFCDRCGQALDWKTFPKAIVIIYP